MSMHLYVYVGPYAVIRGGAKFNTEDLFPVDTFFEHVSGEDLLLLPNTIEVGETYGRHDESEADRECDAARIAREIRVFSKHYAKDLAALPKSKAVRVAWGAVPYWL